MKKKEPPPPFPPPPDHLSEASKALWKDLGPQVAVTLGRRAVFLSALESLTLAERARQLIAAEGLSQTEGNGGKMTHLHPAVRTELESRRLFLSAWKELGLTTKPASTNQGWSL